MSAIAMYRITFRVLETWDEHFYETDQFGYHWSLMASDFPTKYCARFITTMRRNSWLPEELNFKN